MANPNTIVETAEEDGRIHYFVAGFEVEGDESTMEKLHRAIGLWAEVQTAGYRLGHTPTIYFIGALTVEEG